MVLTAVTPSIASPSAVVRWRSPATSAPAEGLSIAQIADRLGRSPATIKAYLRPDGS